MSWITAPTTSGSFARLKITPATTTTAVAKKTSSTAADSGTSERLIVVLLFFCFPNGSTHPCHFQARFFFGRCRFVPDGNHVGFLAFSSTSSRISSLDVLQCPVE